MCDHIFIENFWGEKICARCKNLKCIDWDCHKTCTDGKLCCTDHSDVETLINEEIKKEYENIP